MTWWVINCPGAAPGPAPRSLFLLYDKKERKKEPWGGAHKLWERDFLAALEPPAAPFFSATTVGILVSFLSPPN